MSSTHIEMIYLPEGAYKYVRAKYIGEKLEADGLVYREEYLSGDDADLCFHQHFLLLHR